ncbi:MAG: lamin tail domain-containing protein, partial [Planctomycetota bacterium]
MSVKAHFLPLILSIFLVFSALPAETSANTTLVINELMADNTGSARDQYGDADDWIEIYNTGNSSVNIGRMYLTDNQTADAGWRVPDDDPDATTIPPKGFLLIWADDETNEGTLHASFKLGADGENIRLFAADGKTLIDEVTFGRQDEDRSYGRIPDGSEDLQTIATPTPGKSNTSAPISVVITEIMYHPYHSESAPEDIRAEYIELFNRGTEPVSLLGWRISNGVDFVFPDMMLGAREYLAVAADVDIFKTVYPSVSNVVGGWEGRLSNRGEAIEILDDTGVLIDSVPYADEGDWMVRELGPVDRGHRGWVWAASHDGGGQALELINADMPNEYGQNWTASDVNALTPGAVNSAADDNVAPFILDVIHTPIIPKDDDMVVVTARIFDELRTNITVTLHYRVDVSVYEDRDIYPHHDPNTYSRLAMFDDGANNDGE